MFKCFMCGFARETLDEFVAHGVLRDHDADSVRCPKCNSRMIGEDDNEEEEVGYAS